MKIIVLTGGGTGGHVMPALALVEDLKKNKFEINYIGSKNGIERDLVKDIAYYPISTGKLRRYLDIKNFTDMFRTAKGVKDALKVLRKLKPDVIFSKGGFVTVPVVLAAAVLRIPIVLHESDMTPGLANKIAMPFAKYICTTYPETLNHIAKKRGIFTGGPIRAQLLLGNKNNAAKLLGFSELKSVLLVICGSQGSVVINNAIYSHLSELLKNFNIVHICGKGNINQQLVDKEGYKQFEFLKEELADIYSISDIIVSRAGSNTLSEILALKKPSLLIPLSMAASRGDQILNAQSFKKRGYSLVLDEQQLKEDIFVKKIEELYENKEQYIKTMEKSENIDSIKKIIDVIESAIV